MSAPFCRCSHAKALHLGFGNHVCVIEGCDCMGFRRPLAINTPTEAELKTEAREVVRRLLAGAYGEGAAS